jgi:hypothetical protein
LETPFDLKRQSTNSSKITPEKGLSEIINKLVEEKMSSMRDHIKNKVAHDVSESFHI